MITETINEDVISASTWEYAQKKWLKMHIDDSITGIKNQKKSLDKLHKVIVELSIEDAKSLLFVELTGSGNFSMLIHHNDDDFKNLLIFEILNYPNPVKRFNELLGIKIATVMPEAYLNWFKSDLRTSLYLLGLIEAALKKDRITKKGSEELLTYLRDYISIDTFGFMNNLTVIQRMEHLFHLDNNKAWNHNQAIGFLISIKNYYLNNKVENKHVRWIDSNNEEQVQYLCERMDEQNMLILKQNFFPNDTQEMYSWLLASIDKLRNYVDIESENYKKRSERSTVLHLLERAWKAKNDRAEKSELGIGGSIKIYQKNESKLKNLVCEQATSPNKLLNKLVEDEYDRVFD